MSPTLLGASAIASFLGGILALVAPCCVTFVFPAYFASVFREKKRILLMTFIFFLGLSSVLVPVSLGLSALAQTISKYHYEVFLFGGLFLVVLAILAIFGKTLPMPYHPNPDLQKSDPVSVFLLGVISGAASSCCTPVLIGVLTVTALSGTFLYALILSLTYVLGMVFPLLIMSYFWDRFDFSKSRLVQGKVLKWKLFAREYYIHSTQLISAIIFGGMGLLIVILTLTGRTAMSPKYLGTMSIAFNNFAAAIVERSKFLPNFVWAIIFILILIFFLWQAIKFARKEQ